VEAKIAKRLLGRYRKGRLGKDAGSQPLLLLVVDVVGHLEDVKVSIQMEHHGKPPSLPP
jgi:hypothetical protein